MVKNVASQPNKPPIEATPAPIAPATAPPRTISQNPPLNRHNHKMDFLIHLGLLEMEN